MEKIKLPYGKEFLTVEVPKQRLKGILLSKMHHYTPELSQVDLVKKALENPIGTPKLSEMAKGKNKVVIIASDHTRPVPSKVIIPLMLDEVRKGNPNAKIIILISTGCHRETTKDELLAKFGQDIMDNEEIIVHDCDDTSMLQHIGTLPSGGDIVINKHAVDADLLIAEGFIEPHFFAGFSGGRKSVLPGVVARKTVVYNHNAEFIDNPKSRTGIVDGNPIHVDMLFAAKKANLAFIVNVVINSEKEVIHAVAGDCDKAHVSGREFLCSQCMVKTIPSDIVITTNGGYPLDQNIYQAVKGMTAAEATVKKDGVIIMLAKSNDGHGAEKFYETFRDEKDLKRMLSTFRATPKDETIPDQWQSQIFARVLQHARVIFVSDADDTIVKDLHMTPAHSMEEALAKAEEILGNPDASVAVIPDGVSVMVV